MNGHENENMTKSDFVSFKIFLFEADKLKFHCTALSRRKKLALW